MNRCSHLKLFIAFVEAINSFYRDRPELSFLPITDPGFFDLSEIFFFPSPDQCKYLRIFYLVPTASNRFEFEPFFYIF